MTLVKLPRGTVFVRVAVLLIALTAGAFTLRSGLAFLFATEKGAAYAVMIDSSNTNALSMDANERLKTVQLGKDAAQLAAESRRILEISPYEVVPLRTIGIITAANDDEPGAAKLLGIAARLSLRDYLTHAWLLDYRFRTNNIDASVHEADILLRQDDKNWEVILPALIQLTRDERVVKPLAATLAGRPVWRSVFVIGLGTVNPYPESTFALLSRLKALGAPASKEELDPYFLKSAERLNPQQLFAQWVALLPPSARVAGTGLVREGDFIGLDASPPFGWRFYPGDDTYAERSTGPAGMGTALYVAYPALKGTVFANQELVLPPGRYRLSGRAYADDAIQQGTFNWSVICMTQNAQATLGTVAVDPQPAKLVRYAGEFVVPAGCDQQQLALAGVARDSGFDKFEMYVDQIEIKALP